MLYTFSKQAKQLGVYLAIDLQTYTGQSSSLKKHNTLVAFGPGGKVLARHFKFEKGGAVHALERMGYKTVKEISGDHMMVPK